MRTIIPTIALLAAASAGAQTATRSTYGSTAPAGGYDLGRPGRFEIALTPSYGAVSSQGSNYDGVGLEAQFHLPTVFFLKVGAKTWNGGSAYTFGIGTAIPVGNGRITLNWDGTTIDIDGWGFEPQAMLRAAYDHQFAFGLHIGAGVSHFFNSVNVGEDVTAPTLTAGYKFGARGPTLDLTYSNKDAILGSPGANHSILTSLKFAF